MSRPGKFFYFAFGSNLLAERIHIKNPSAVFKCVGKVSGYKLSFGRHVSRWKGDVATITKADPASTVYGVIWELDEKHQETLDRQEEVPNVYKRIQLQAEADQNQIFTCVSYQLLEQHMNNSTHIPSKVYKGVILRGAKQHHLPQEYIAQLEQIPDNGWDADIDEMLDKIRQDSY